MTAIPILPYNLPDMAFFRSCTRERDALVFVPDRYAVVLGRGSDPAHAFHPEAVRADRVPVLQRPSGGETVLLSPRTLVIAVVRNRVPLQDPHRFFQAFSRMIMACLASSGGANLCQRGISDICIGERKILGSSIYWHRKKLLYHAVLNVGEPPETIARYLAHPPREPDYRRGRDHASFVTSLRNEGITIPMEVLRQELEATLKEGEVFTAARNTP